MIIAQLTLLHLLITFCVAIYNLKKWKELKLVPVVAITALWPAIFLIMAMQRDMQVSDPIYLFAWVANPILQAWLLKTACKKIFSKA